MGFHQGHQITQLWHPVSHLRYCGKITHLGCWKYQSAISSYLWHRNRHGEFHIVGVIKKNTLIFYIGMNKPGYKPFGTERSCQGNPSLVKLKLFKLLWKVWKEVNLIAKETAGIIKEEAKPRKVSPEVFSTAAQHVIFYLQTKSSYFYWKQQSRMPQSLH